jgi:hypothetical protein
LAGVNNDLGDYLRTPVNVGFDRAGVPAGHANDQKIWLVKRYTSPPDQPIFLGLNFTISSQYLNSSYFDIAEPDNVNWRQLGVPNIWTTFIEHIQSQTNRFSFGGM